MLKYIFKVRRGARSEPGGSSSLPPKVYDPQQHLSGSNTSTFPKHEPGPAFTPSYSINPTDYVTSPPPSLPTSSLVTPCPVDYVGSSPVPMPHMPAQAAEPETAEDEGRYRSAEPRHPPQVSQPNLPPPYMQPPVLSPNARIIYHRPHLRDLPAELPATPVPARYELSSVSSPSELPTASTTKPGSVPSSVSIRQPGTTPWNSPSDVSNISGTTIVASPTRFQSSPSSPSMNKDASDMHYQGENSGIKKFTVDIFCPPKKDANGIRRKPLPRDVREFRLAKLAVIPIVAGRRTFVSIDVVFGQLDERFSELVEKHFSFCSQTTFTKLDPDSVHGDVVYAVGPLNIAYRDGDCATLYVRFRSPTDVATFQTNFDNMKHYTEQD